MHITLIINYLNYFIHRTRCLLLMTFVFAFANGFQLPIQIQQLPREDRAVIRDLILLNFPPLHWRKTHSDASYDVVIIGGGMAGLTAGAALFKEGIFNIQIFDENSAGLEGPWITYARMKTLRTHKEIMGPALGIPHLTFRAWYDAKFGSEDWKKMEKIPNNLWMDYLKWFRDVMQLPVENHCKLKELIPNSKCLELKMECRGESFFVKAKKVILATGRAGFGGVIIPDVVKDLPKTQYSHTAEIIDFKKLKDKKIAILGVGASSFDAAATALENQAKEVDLIMRKNRIPTINKFGSLPYKGFVHGYYQLADEQKWNFMKEALESAIPPPLDSIKRVENYSNLRVLANTTIEKIECNSSQIHVLTNHGQLTYDFLILGTGFKIDGKEQLELKDVIDDIALWKDKMPSDLFSDSKMGLFPYLGPSFEFLPKKENNTSYLKNIYCFNYAATMSHGLLSGDIPSISVGASRMAQGIAADFFIEDSEWYLNHLKTYEQQEFQEGDFHLNIVHPAEKS